MQPVLYIVIPCYNEEQVLPITSVMFRDKLIQMIGEGKIKETSKVVFVNDGSKDKTWEIICELAKKEDCIEGITLSRNRGHQHITLLSRIFLISPILFLSREPEISTRQ